MSGPAPGSYEDIPASIALVLPLPFLALYLANRAVFPIAQREPWMCVLANAAYGFLVMAWMFEQAHPELPLLERDIIVPMTEWVIFGVYLVRVWKLYMDHGIAHERVQGQQGWFIKHRRYRERKFLLKIMAFLYVVHFINLVIALVENSNFLVPARQSSKTNFAAVYSVIYNFAYFISFIVLACKLAGKQDGFFLKREFQLVGAGSGGLTIFWFAVVLSGMPCTISSCSTLILWFSWLSMLSFSIVLPIGLAIRYDRRFSFTRCFRTALRRNTDSQSRSIQSISDLDSKDVEFRESQDEGSPRNISKFTDEQLEQYRRVPLSKYLTHPDGRESFRAFTVKEFSVENLLFVEAVAVYKSKTPTKAEAVALYELYVADSSANQVNLPSAVKHRLVAAIGEVDGPDLIDFFDQAEEHIMKLMNRDAFKRYQITEDWARYVVKFEVHKHAPEETKTTKTTSSEPSLAVASSVTLDVPSSSPDRASTPNPSTPTGSFTPEERSVSPLTSSAAPTSDQVSVSVAV